jgi:ferredoxin
MQVEIDTNRCEGHARCLECAPEVFGYDDVTNQAYLLEDADPDAHADAVREAAIGCPELAITVHETASTGAPRSR